MTDSDFDGIVGGLVGRRLLIGLDFDGTLSEIVLHADDAVPVAGAIEVLAKLAALGTIDVAIVSGRSIVDLRRMLGPLPGVRLVGEHGADWDEPEPPPKPAFMKATKVGLADIATRYPGAWLEVKRTTLCFHTRGVAGELEPDVLAEVAAYLEDQGDDLTWRRGKKVVDVTFFETSKGQAVEQLRRQLGTEAVLFIGDDATDESVFERLGEHDFGIKVGDGHTEARYRIGGPAGVVVFLERLATAVENW